jgi:DNA polymerase III subunit delta'
VSTVTTATDTDADGRVDADRPPVAALFAGVVAQDEAVAALRAAAAHPVHAYLLRGPSGNGGLAAAYGFAAALLCPDGGCGTCATCRAALAGTDPDLHVVRRSGASVSIGEIRQVVALAQRRPLHAARQVIVVLDVHLAALRAPALLKTLEEPPGDTVFVLLSDQIVPELVTIASRCVEIDFPPVPRAELVDWLTAAGVPDDMAAVVADSSGGNPERARVMVDDPDVAARVALWQSVPEALGSAGTTAATLTRQVLESADRAVEPLRAAHAREIEALTAAAKEMGERGLPGRKETLDQHQREERRFRTDALRAGLGVLARTYRAQVVRAATSGVVAVGDQDIIAASEAIGLITEAAEALPRNPNESLLLQSLFVRLAALGA